MDQQNSNGVNTQNVQNPNPVHNNQAQRAPMNGKPQSEQNKPNQERRYDRNQNQDKRMDRNKTGDRNQSNHHDKNRNQGDNKYNNRPKDHKSPERGRNDNNQSAKPQPHFNNPGQNNNPAFNSNNNRYGKNAFNSSAHGENPVRNIKAKRIETVEDIQADIERIDKDIQFEIKQIKAVKLGL